MKIGILTEVNDCNYGALLQAFALAHTLSGLGHTAQQIDFWYKPYNKALWGNLAKAASPIGWCWRFLQLAQRLKSVTAAQSWTLRALRSKAFIDTFIPLSPKTYRTAEDLKTLPSYDTLIAGSDQVWNPDHFAAPNPFLLSSVHTVGKKLAYAASIGREDIPEDRIAEYRQAFSEFAAISLREQSNLRQVRELSTCPVSTVLDPSLLISAGEWRTQLHLRALERCPDICIYWLGDIDPLMEVVHAILSRGETIAVFTEPSFLRQRTRDKRNPLKALNIQGVHYQPEADPRTFLQTLDAAEEVVSDSFHALMFSVIFRKRCQILLDTSASRREMSVRLTDFASTYLKESPIIDSPDAYIRERRATHPLEPTDALEIARKDSLAWLKKNL